MKLLGIVFWVSIIGLGRIGINRSIDRC